MNMETDPAFIDLFAQPMTWLLLAVYFFPSIMAIFNKSAGWACCFWVNLFFGWTFIGWLICLLLGSVPTKAQLAYRDKVRRAKDEFYLHEAQKAERS
jgi:hypothetical protein